MAKATTTTTTPAAKKSSLFTVAKTKKSKKASSGSALVRPNKQLQTTIDEFCAYHAQYNLIETEMEIRKNTIKQDSMVMFAERNFNGTPGNFIILGEESAVNFIIQDSSGRTVFAEEQIEALAEAYGEKIAECYELDKTRVGINVDFLEQDDNEEKLRNALEALGPEFAAALFKETTYKIKKGSLAKVTHLAKDEEHLANMIQDMKFGTQLRVKAAS